MSGTLYVVATPIGNTADITDRARRTLSEVDIIAAEDTRTTRTLLNILGIEGKTVSNHKFNEKKQLEALLSALTEGKDVAVVSDAGTPCVSDPGAVLVKGAADAGIAVVGVCGASAVVTAVSVSGFEGGGFAFYGFLPRTKKELGELLKKASDNGDLISVFFESPMRIKDTARYLAVSYPAAEMCLCNDLTKKFERIYRGSPEAVLGELETNPSAEKGEYTLVLKLPPKEKEREAGTLSPEAALVDYIAKNRCPPKEAVGALAAAGAYSKKELYAASLTLKKLFSGRRDGEENTD